jgi:DNA-binding MarR family transcriptional regulator
MKSGDQTSSCLSYNLRKASRVVSKLYAKEMRLAPVRGPQFSLMMAIARRECPAISALAKEIGADRTTMTRNLNHLQKKGFVQVIQGKDMRTKAVQISPRGRKALDQSISYWQKAQAGVLKALGEERRERILDDLSVLSGLAQRS